MAFFFNNGPVATDAPIAGSNHFTINADNYVQGKESLAIVGAAVGFNVSNIVAAPSFAFVGQVHEADSFHRDFHFRFYLIPEELRLSNPTINTDIAFKMWNTHRVPQTLLNLQVQGSNVLTFGLQVNDVVADSKLLTTTVSIGPGEPNIDAIANFTFTDGLASLPIIATVSETFNLVPDVPVRETWEFLTDIITSFNGQEQRISLRPEPRRTMDFDVDILDLKDRRAQYELVFKNMGLQAIIPAYHHATNLTGDTPIGGSKYYFDPAVTQMRVGEYLVVINPQTEYAQITQVLSVDADGATGTSASGVDLDKTWYVYPAHAMIVKNGSGLNMQQTSGKLHMKTEGFSTPTLPRPNAAPVINQLNGIDIMEMRPLISADERFSFRADIVDFEVGVKDIKRKADPHTRISGSRRWRISRYDNPEEEDYMRQFIDNAKGAHKAWFMPTFFPDLTYVSGATNLSGVITVAELNYPSLFHQFNTWKQIRIEYKNLPATYHTVDSAAVNGLGTLTELSLNPVLADDVEVANITKICFLHKVRGTDTIRRQHFARETFYSWAIQTVDD